MLRETAHTVTRNSVQTVFFYCRYGGSRIDRYAVELILFGLPDLPSPMARRWGLG